MTSRRSPGDRSGQAAQTAQRSERGLETPGAHAGEGPLGWPLRRPPSLAALHAATAASTLAFRSAGSFMTLARPCRAPVVHVVGIRAGFAVHVVAYRRSAVHDVLGHRRGVPGSSIASVAASALRCCGWPLSCFPWRCSLCSAARRRAGSRRTWDLVVSHRCVSALGRPITAFTPSVR